MNVPKTEVDLDLKPEYVPIKKCYKKKEKGQYAPINQYMKKRILSHMQEYGSDNIEIIMKNYKCDPSELEKFVNMQAKNSENGVQHECNSTTLQSLLTWIEGFKNSGFNQTAIKELPLALKAISRLEAHPSPVDCDGVNFKELYLFIGNVMSGDPAVELNEPTRNFLCDILGELIDDINNDDGDENVLKLRDELLNQVPKEGKSLTLEEQMLQIGLNPLMLEFR